MADSILRRMANAFNAFMGAEKRELQPYDYGTPVMDRRDRLYPMLGGERSIVSAVQNRIAVDVSEVSFRHVKMERRTFKEEVTDSGISYCLNTEANIDQAARYFRQDLAASILEEGVIAVIPVDTSVDPATTDSYEVRSLRIGQILEWYPRHIRVRAYDDRTGVKRELTLPKSDVAIVENPLYSVMNEPNSTFQRLVRKLALLDAVDAQSSAGKLDLLIQLPYVVKNETRRTMAEKRREDIEVQLQNSKYGIAYIDGTERITQLNRPAENNLMAQIEYLTKRLLSELGITDEILNGTASEEALRNYRNRTVIPIVKAIAEEFNRKFLSKNARTAGQQIVGFWDPFEFMSVEQIAESGTKLVSSAVVSPNEVRSWLQVPPSSDPNADKLQNPNTTSPDKEVSSAVQNDKYDPLPLV